MFVGAQSKAVFSEDGQFTFKLGDGFVFIVDDRKSLLIQFINQ
ncbi:hypothetical protein JCM19233_396 [Vibrio astriarenae]|nr:hypothetical protein JCM19233_396 [Vibrio sp. C7]